MVEMEYQYKKKKPKTTNIPNKIERTECIIYSECILWKLLFYLQCYCLGKIEKRALGCLEFEVYKRQPARPTVVVKKSDPKTL